MPSTSSETTTTESDAAAQDGLARADMVYVLLLNWKGWGDTIECLESVFRSNYPRYRVVVCDNDSGDGSMENLQAWAEGRLDCCVPKDNPLRSYSFPPCKKPIEYAFYDRATAEAGGRPEDASLPLVFIQTGANLGVGGGFNVGLRYALACEDMDSVWILNNDSVAHADALAALAARVGEDRSIGQCGSTLCDYAEPEEIVCMGGGRFSKWSYRSTLMEANGTRPESCDPRQIEDQLDFVSGASWFVPRAFLERIGLLDEELFLYFHELVWRERSHGTFRLGYAPKSYVYHKDGASTGKGGAYITSPASDRYYLEAGLQFTKKFFPRRVPYVYLLLVAYMLRRMQQGLWDRVPIILGVMRRGLFAR